MQEKTNKLNIFQELMGNRIVQIVLWGTIAIGATGVIFAIVAIRSGAGDEQIKTAFGIFQYVIGVLLPLWGTWIGTILAYYYSKDNFESANKNAQQIIDKMTTDKKLETIKIRDVMMPIDKLIYQKMNADKPLSKFKLKEDCLDFVNGKKIKRVLLFDEATIAKYVLHRDTISFFIADQALSGNSVTDLTLQSMADNGSPDIKEIFKNGIAFLSPEDNLFKAKQIMDNNKACQDIFITQDGASTNPVLGWITNVEISDNSKV